MQLHGARGAPKDPDQESFHARDLHAHADGDATWGAWLHVAPCLPVLNHLPYESHPVAALFLVRLCGVLGLPLPAAAHGPVAPTQHTNVGVVPLISRSASVQDQQLADQQQIMQEGEAAVGCVMVAGGGRCDGSGVSHAVGLLAMRRLLVVVLQGGPATGSTAAAAAGTTAAAAGSAAAGQEDGSEAATAATATAATALAAVCPPLSLSDACRLSLLRCCVIMGTGSTAPGSTADGCTCSTTGSTATAATSIKPNLAGAVLSDLRPLIAHVVRGAGGGSGASGMAAGSNFPVSGCKPVAAALAVPEPAVISEATAAVVGSGRGAGEQAQPGSSGLGSGTNGSDLLFRGALLTQVAQRLHELGLGYDAGQ